MNILMPRKRMHIARDVIYASEIRNFSVGTLSVHVVSVKEYCVNRWRYTDVLQQGGGVRPRQLP